ncbi:MAG: XdhC family protein [Candidatus Methylacidiphilaceae bacterium]
MDSSDFVVLAQARDWRRVGFEVILITVAESRGSAPQQLGALCAIRADGAFAGSVSGGCLEEEWIERVRAGETLSLPRVAEYGVDRGETRPLRLPCGGMLRLVVERIGRTDWIDAVLARTNGRRSVSRILDLADGSIQLSNSDAEPAEATRLEGRRFITVFSPPWRLLLVGAGELSRLLAEMARPLGYEVLLCDPREAYAPAALSLGVRYLPGMPDEVIADLPADSRTAILALSHDSSLDDMALLTALKSEAFFVGALGSRAAAAKRRERLAPYFFPEELDRLRSPVGLDLGTRRPGEIAVAILAELIAVQNGQNGRAKWTAPPDSGMLVPSARRTTDSPTEPGIQGNAGARLGGLSDPDRKRESQ